MASPGRPATGETKKRNIRVPDPEWDDFGVGAAAMGTDRAGAANAFIRWYTHRPGAELPQRPPVEAFAQ